jgi:SnoaL-like polyketide cyclase
MACRWGGDKGLAGAGERWRRVASRGERGEECLGEDGRARRGAGGLRRLLIEDDWLSVHLTDTGTHAATFLGVPATGRKISARELAMCRVVGGRIVES